jgi:hypothetical protein
LATILLRGNISNIPPQRLEEKYYYPKNPAACPLPPFPALFINGSSNQVSSSGTHLRKLWKQPIYTEQPWGADPSGIR